MAKIKIKLTKKEVEDLIYDKFITMFDGSESMVVKYQWTTRGITLDTETVPEVSDDWFNNHGITIANSTDE